MRAQGSGPCCHTRAAQRKRRVLPTPAARCRRPTSIGVLACTTHGLSHACRSCTTPRRGPFGSRTGWAAMWAASPAPTSGAAVGLVLSCSCYRPIPPRPFGREREDAQPGSWVGAGQPEPRPGCRLRRSSAPLGQRMPQRRMLGRQRAVRGCSSRVVRGARVYIARARVLCCHRSWQPDRWRRLGAKLHELRGKLYLPLSARNHTLITIRRVLSRLELPRRLS
jgi:hypothetical protein